MRQVLRKFWQGLNYSDKRSSELASNTVKPLLQTKLKSYQGKLGHVVKFKSRMVCWDGDVYLSAGYVIYLEDSEGTLECTSFEETLKGVNTVNCIGWKH